MVQNTATPGDVALSARRLLVVMAITAIVAGASTAIFGEDALSLWSFVILVQMIVWCHRDARARQFPLRRGLRLLLILFGVIGLPVYFFRSRGLAGGLRALLLLILFAAVLIVLCSGSASLAMMVAALNH